MRTGIYVVRSPIRVLSGALFSENNSAVVPSLEDPSLPEKYYVRRISPD
jgi:hypothetical protein